MPEKLSEFSAANLSAIYRCIGLEITVDAQQETSHRPNSADAFQKIFRTPSRLVDEIVGFNRRFAQACVDKLAASLGISVPDPWNQSAENQLVSEVLDVLARIRKIVDRNWSPAFPLVAVVQERAEHDLRQRISEEFEAGRDDYWEAKSRQTNRAASDGGQPSGAASPAQDLHQPKIKKPRGKTATELLHEWWADPAKREKLLAAGSAGRIGDLIGKSETAVKEAGPVWSKKIAPALKSIRIVAVAVQRDEEWFSG